MRILYVVDGSEEVVPALRLQQRVSLDHDVDPVTTVAGVMERLRERDYDAVIFFSDSRAVLRSFVNTAAISTVLGAVTACLDDESEVKV